MGKTETKEARPENPQPATQKAPTREREDEATGRDGLKELANTLAMAIKEGFSQAAQDNMGHQPRRPAKRGRRTFEAGTVSTGLPDLLRPAVIVRAKGGNYAKALSIMKDAIRERGQEIGKVTLRRTRVGNMLVELANNDANPTRAAALARMTDERLRSCGASAYCPSPSADILLSDLDPSVGIPEIQEGLVSKATSSEGQVRVGRIAPQRHGLSTTRVSCPLELARLLVNEGYLTIGWP